MKSLIIVSLSLLGSIASASSYHIRCIANQGPFVIEGTLDENLSVFSYVDQGRLLSKSVTPDAASVLDSRCGSLQNYPINFEVTPSGFWGQYFLQLPDSVFSNSVKSFGAVVHTCDYDGNRSSYEDSALTCSETVQP